MEVPFKMIFIYLVHMVSNPVNCFWDFATTTPPPYRDDFRIRTSFFRWQRTEFQIMRFWFPWFDWVDISNRRRLCVIAGVSIDFTPLGTATILNKRVLITAASLLSVGMYRQRDIRIWVLGRAGRFDTPYRYRAHRLFRIFPKSANPEHQHGPRGTHVPRHDVAIIITKDQMYIYYMRPTRYMYAYPATLTGARWRLMHEELMMAGSGYEYLQHIYENYKIFYAILKRDNVVDCSRYLPKWWGKFICIKNVKRYAGVPNGGALLSDYMTLVGLGCFEIRYNEDRIMVFTDLRYYVRWIHKYADIYPGQYYEYAYPQWGIRLGSIYDGHSNNPYIPIWQVQDNMYPLG